MRLATDGVEFSFNNTMYAKMMVSPLGHKKVPFERLPKPHVYFRHVNEPFSIFDSIKAFHV